MSYHTAQDQYSTGHSRNIGQLPLTSGPPLGQYTTFETSPYDYVEADTPQFGAQVDKQALAHMSSLAKETYDVNGEPTPLERSRMTSYLTTSPVLSLKSDKSSAPSNHYAHKDSADYNYSSAEAPVHDYRPSTSYATFNHDDASDTSLMTYNAYAPSPSLLGSNDPLGRNKSKHPVISFGFGGKVVTCFHSPAVVGTGFDVALSERRSTLVQLHQIRRLINFSSDDTENVFPGPLVGDQSLSTASLVRTGLNSTIKSRKSRVTAYLEHYIGITSRDLGYLPSGSPQHRQAADKLIMLRLLRIMLIHDGQISGR